VFVQTSPVQARPTEQGLPEPTQRPEELQVEVVVQPRPSSHGALGVGGCVQVPEPLQTSFVQAFPSLAQGVPSGRGVREQVPVRASQTPR
jgi:hypothetical protein